MAREIQKGYDKLAKQTENLKNNDYYGGLQKIYLLCLSIYLIKISEFLDFTAYETLVTFHFFNLRCMFQKTLTLFSVKKCDSGPVLQLVNGQALTSKTSFFNGDQVEYLCNIGYKVGNSLAKSQTVICQDGDWDILPSCMRKLFNTFKCSIFI